MVSARRLGVLALVAPLLLGSTPAAAHGPAPVGPGEIIGQWTFHPVVLGPLLLALGLYASGIGGLPRRLGRWPPVLPTWRIACFAAGGLMLVAALISPVDALSDGLLSAHMLQHVILIALAPPLLALGRPEIACFRGLPAQVRRRLARSPAWRALGRCFAAMCRPMPATLIHGVALWLWHAPVLFEAASISEVLHWLEHLFFFSTALLFWRGLVEAGRSSAKAVVGMAAALVTLVHGGFLSALITLSPVVLYPRATRGAALWGLSPLDDQQLAGVIMWVPAGAAYLAAGLLLAARLLVAEPPGSRMLRKWPSPA